MLIARQTRRSSSYLEPIHGLGTRVHSDRSYVPSLSLGRSSSSQHFRACGHSECRGPSIFSSRYKPSNSWGVADFGIIGSTLNGVGQTDNCKVAAQKIAA